MYKNMLDITNVTNGTLYRHSLLTADNRFSTQNNRKNTLYTNKGLQGV